MSGMPTNWSQLESQNSTSLKENYLSAYEKFDKMERAVKSQVLIALYKLEAFSILIIHGNLDKELAIEIFGYTFIKQTGLLVGLISFFRKENEDKFGHYTLRLYNDWKAKEKKTTAPKSL